MNDASPSRQLREATWDLHQSLEHLPLNQALARGQIPLPGYLALLQAYYAVHQIVDPVLARIPDLPDPIQPRGPLLQADLADFGEIAGANAEPATILALAETVQAWSGGEALGLLYVFEGSTLGGAMLYPRLQAKFGKGTRYWHPYGDEARACWGITTTFLDQRLDAATLPAAREAARAVFLGLDAILRDLPLSD